MNTTFAYTSGMLITQHLQQTETWSFSKIAAAKKGKNTFLKLHDKTTEEKIFEFIYLANEATYPNDLS